MFKQKVTTDDVFLGMSGKNSSTACCEDLVVCMKVFVSDCIYIELDYWDYFATYIRL